VKTNNTFNSVINFLSRKKVILIVYILITIAASVVQYSRGEKKFGDKAYTEINNYIIFKQSYFHLIHDQDLYKLYPDEHWDFYKYSPTFALSMGVLAYFPNVVSLTIWNLANSLLLFYALSKIELISENKKNILLWVVLPELVISTQNSQSNGLTAALMIMTYNYFEQNKISWAALTAVLGFFIKIYGGFAALLFIFHPNKSKFISWCFFFFGILFCLPLFVLEPSELIFLYKSWLHLLQFDANTSVGLSVAGWLQSWFNLTPPKTGIIIAGAIAACLPLLRSGLFSDKTYRLIYFTSLMIWIIIFNHKSESPTFIIAIAGAAIWYFSTARNKIHTTLFILAFVFSSLSPTDIFPAFVRTNLVIPYVLKVVPFIAIWGVMMWEMVSYKSKRLS